MKCKRLIPGVCMSLLLASCGTLDAWRKGTTVTEYKVGRLQEAPVINAEWDKDPWNGIKPLIVGNYMGEKPGHLPRTEAKLACDDEAVYVIFRVEDRYVRAVAGKHQDVVCTDSCAEFFFAPTGDVADGYFNLEMNCGGIMLFNFQLIPRKDSVPVAESDLARIEVAHSAPRRIDPEIGEPYTWSVEYRLPFAILANYLPSAVPPGAGTVWRANFFKCGDNTSRPHWLTWAPVDRPRPDFHVPEAFGVIEFE